MQNMKAKHSNTTMCMWKSLTNVIRTNVIWHPKETKPEIMEVVQSCSEVQLAICRIMHPATDQGVERTKKL